MIAARLASSSAYSFLAVFHVSKTPASMSVSAGSYETHPSLREGWGTQAIKGEGLETHGG